MNIKVLFKINLFFNIQRIFQKKTKFLGYTFEK